MFKQSLIITTLSILLLSGCGNSSSSTFAAYGCEDKNELKQCKGKPLYLGDISFIVSKEGRSVKMTQTPAKGSSFLTEGTYNLDDCTITNSENWSCKEKSPYGELFFNKEMVDGFFMSSITTNLVNVGGMGYIGYQGIKGQLIKHGIWRPTDLFKEGKATP